MSEILLVGPHGSPGVAKDVPARQIRLSWYVGEGDSPTATLRDAQDGTVDRYPGSCPGISTDGPYWLLDLAAMPDHVSTVDLSVAFRVAREAGFEAMVGLRTFVHPGVSGSPGQARLLASLRRDGPGWSLVPFDRPADSDAPAGPSTGGAHPRSDHRESQTRTGRLLVVVDASGSMAPGLRDGSVTAATMEAVQTTGRPEVLLRGTDGTAAAVRLGGSTLSADVGRFCSQVAEAARHTRADVGAVLRSLPVEPDDEVVVITDAAPADVAGVHDALGGRRARWFVLGASPLAAFPADRRRLDQLADVGVRVRLVAAG